MSVCVCVRASVCMQEQSCDVASSCDCEKIFFFLMRLVMRAFCCVRCDCY